jgi:diguanylate cyclase (GGDEF)-like protein/PAS domain S-box-containing protein
MAQRVLAERVSLLYRFSLISIRSVLVTSAVLGVLLWHVIPRLSVWLAYMGFMLWARFALYKFYFKAKPQLGATSYWGKLFVISAFAHGCGWGLLGSIFFPPDDELYQSIVIFTIAGVGAAGIATLAPLRQAYAAFLFPAVLPLIVQMLVVGGSVYIATALLLLVLALVLYSNSRGISDAIAETCEKRFENEALAKTLTAAKRQVDNFNIGLQREIAERKKIQEALKQSEKHYRDLVETSSDLVWSIDAAGCFSYVNHEAARRIYGREPEEILGRPLSAFENPRQDHYRQIVAAAQAGHDRLQFDALHELRDGTPVILSFNLLVLRDEHGRFAGATGTASDITSRKLAEQRLNKMLSEYQFILENAAVGMALLKQKTIVQCNRRLEEMFGYSVDELADRSVAVLYPSPEIFDEVQAAYPALAAGKPWQADFPMKRKDGSSFWCHLASKAIDPDHLESGTIWVFTDVSERRQREELVQHLAYHDALTELPNRALLQDRLEQMLIQARRAGDRLAVLFLDLDRFKVVNDTLGHQAGDSLLQVVAARLKSCVREGDTVSRQGGDEFVIVLADLRHPADADRVAQKILHTVAKPMEIGASEFHLTTSIGISIYPDDAEDAAALLKQADTAMYHAKEQGGHSHYFFTREMNARSSERLLLESSLRRGIEKGEFSLSYQPKFDLRTGQVSGVEALVRWQHPELKLIPPHRFIRIAEETGLIVQLGYWVLESACAQTKQWQQAGHPGLRVAVNLSPRQLQEKGLELAIASILARLDFPATCLELEITESMLVRNPEETAQTLQELETRGVSIAIDDFGTGYSSLAQLKRFPVHTLKIDRAFIDGLPHDSDDTAITLAIIAMAKSLDLKVVAEGVENQQQLAFLKAHGCHEVQGYALARPLSVADMDALLRETCAA